MQYVPKDLYTEGCFIFENNSPKKKNKKNQMVGEGNYAKAGVFLYFQGFLNISKKKERKQKGPKRDDSPFKNLKLCRY